MQQQMFEYHTLRCNFGDLQTHLNEYASKEWRVHTIHHGHVDEKMVYVVMEREHKEPPKGGF